ncbi:uncharacterized protein MELLADRAFT_70645 [Melampsora larici-populina 98AG31]|uniref:Uncharacterized protein n=1 Tax=Melampsora larici-populina (strain 98AG31 / pathotype 3-4-7) TaxID=747676 RepID=F4R4Z7_MELLP|nr:uncharacterized protein MELLADRAFT_70645 [Melampsora larici-populina 98AG31]EGG11968.1 hypothetical protein MELLADRAFT_70645 [Melampsora larici-populina 98AG31]
MNEQVKLNEITSGLLSNDENVKGLEKEENPKLTEEKVGEWSMDDIIINNHEMNLTKDSNQVMDQGELRNDEVMENLEELINHQIRNTSLVKNSSR